MHDENQYLIRILILLNKILIWQLCIVAECYAIFKNSLKAVKSSEKTTSIGSSDKSRKNESLIKRG